MKQVYPTTNFLRNAAVITAVILITGFASFSQTVPELVFQNPSRTGTAGAVNTTYKFASVATGIDAIVKITAKSDNNVTLSDIDLTSTGFLNAFQPQTSYNGGNAPKNTTWYMEFSISFVSSSNNLTPVTVTGFNATALDIDGDDNRLREQVTLFGLNSYTVNNPTDLTIGNVTNGKIFTGSYTDYSNINTSATNLMTTAKYVNTSSFTMRVGGSTGNQTSSKSERMSSIWFKSFTYSNPSNSAVLPINLLSFNARQINKAVNLDWATSMEKDFSHFIVQKSTDGSSFRDIATIFSDGSNSTSTKAYAYTDKSETAGTIAYYRLLMIDIDGKYKYSDVRIIRTDNKSQASIATYPNPATSELRVTVPDSWQNKKVTYTIYSSTGVAVKQKANGQASQTEVINLSGLNAGMYLIKVENGIESTTKQFIKQN